MYSMPTTAGTWPCSTNGESVPQDGFTDHALAIVRQHAVQKQHRRSMGNQLDNRRVGRRHALPVATARVRTRIDQRGSSVGLTFTRPDRPWPSAAMSGRIAARRGCRPPAAGQAHPAPPAYGGDPPARRSGGCPRESPRSRRRPAASTSAAATGAVRRPGRIDSRQRLVGDDRQHLVAAQRQQGHRLQQHHRDGVVPGRHRHRGRLVLAGDRQLAGRAVVHAVLEAQRRQQAVPLALFQHLDQRRQLAERGADHDAQPRQRHAGLRRSPARPRPPPCSPAGCSGAAASTGRSARPRPRRRGRTASSPTSGNPGIHKPIPRTRARTVSSPGRTAG